jgi:hypothetical protein
MLWSPVWFILTENFTKINKIYKIIYKIIYKTLYLCGVYVTVYYYENLLQRK